jgi:MOSC domain-containing protein YiiM
MLTGRLESIFIGPEPGEPMVELDQVQAVSGAGLEGDRYFKAGQDSPNQKQAGRQVTLIEVEALEALERDFGILLSLGGSRRNLITRAVPLNHLVGREFRIGEVTLRGIQLCEPCSHLASMTEKKVLPALVHRGGLRAQIITGGTLRTGDTITLTDRG